MIIGCTGHRPDKLPNKETGYKLPNKTYIYICKETEKLLLELKPDKCITGMALGYDQYFANICIKLGIPFIAAIPFEDQDKNWFEDSKKIYKRLLGKASEIVVVSPPGYSAHKMQLRNQYIVDNSDLLIACWNGSAGGTANCVNYAKLLNKKILVVDPVI